MGKIYNYCRSSFADIALSIRSRESSTGFVIFFIFLHNGIRANLSAHLEVPTCVAPLLQYSRDATVASNY